MNKYAHLYSCPKCGNTFIGEERYDGMDWYSVCPHCDRTFYCSEGDVGYAVTIIREVLGKKIEIPLTIGEIAAAYAVYKRKDCM